MKRNKSLIPMLLGLLFLYSSCESNKDEFLSDYSTILYFVDSGEVPLTLYKTGEDANYEVSVYKAGSNAQASAGAEAKVMSTDELAAYNVENGTDFTLLPADNYELKSGLNLSFTASAMNQSIDFSFKTDMIDQLPDIPGQYVLPLKLSSSSDSVNTEKNWVILKPEVIVPSVYFTKTGYNETIISEDGEEITVLEVDITMPMDNQWTFDCTVSVDQDALDAYNQANGTNFELLAEDSYSLTNTVSFTPGENAKTIEISVDRKNLSYGQFVLPLKLTDCSMEAFVIDQEQNLCLFGVSYIPPKIDLTADMLSTNAQEASEGPIANLVDDNTNTMFHTSWSAAIYSSWGHYIDVALTEPINKVILNFWTRKENGNGAPSNIILYVSNDGVDFTELATISEGMPTTGNTEYVSPLFQSAESFKYLRIAVTQSAAGEMSETSASYFNMAELMLFGSNQ